VQFCLFNIIIIKGIQIWYEKWSLCLIEPHWGA